MELDLHQFVIPSIEIPPGYRFVAWDDQDLSKHAEVKYLSFRNEIDANVFSCFESRKVASDYYEKSAPAVTFYRTLPGFWLQIILRVLNLKSYARFKRWSTCMDEERYRILAFTPNTATEA